jgi:hypothetical protein
LKKIHESKLTPESTAPHIKVHQNSLTITKKFSYFFPMLFFFFRRSIVVTFVVPIKETGRNEADERLFHWTE